MKDVNFDLRVGTVHSSRAGYKEFNAYSYGYRFRSLNALILSLEEPLDPEPTGPKPLGKETP